MAYQSKTTNYERYALTPERVYTLFSEDLALPIRFHDSDTVFRFEKEEPRPCTEEHVIACVTFYDRGKALMEFFAVREPGFDCEYRAQFEEECLPRLLGWYREVRALPETSLPGVERFLIVWHEEQFTTHRYRFQE